MAAGPTRPISAYSGSAAPPAPSSVPLIPPRPSSAPGGYPNQPVFPGPVAPPQRSPRDAAPSRNAYAPQTRQPAYLPPQQRPAHLPPARQPAGAPLRQAPRQPRPVGYDTAPRNGIGCLGKLAILFIVLALAALIGVEIGNRIAKDRGESGILNHHASVSISYRQPGFRGSSR
jgi:hypothetical protein